MKKSILFLVLFALVFFSFQAFAVDSFPAGTRLLQPLLLLIPLPLQTLGHGRVFYTA